MSTTDAAPTPISMASSKSPNFLHERRAMEETRLARLGKPKREPSPEPDLFNPGQGSPDAWQLGELVEDFSQASAAPKHLSLHLCLDLGT